LPAVTAIIEKALVAARQDERRKFFCQCPWTPTGEPVPPSPESPTSNASGVIPDETSTNMLHRQRYALAEPAPTPAPAAADLPDEAEILCEIFNRGQMGKDG